MGYNGSKDGKTRAFKSDMFPKRKFPKLIKGSSSLGKVSLMPTMQEIEEFSSFFYDLLDVCKECRSYLIKKDIRIRYILILIDLAFLAGFFVWESGFCLILGSLLTCLLLANIWLLCLYVIILWVIFLLVH